MSDTTFEFKPFATGEFADAAAFSTRDQQELGQSAPVLAHALHDWEPADLHYSGDFGDVTQRLGTAIQEQDMVRSALFVARLTRGVLDARTDNPGMGIDFDAVLSVSNLALNVLSGWAVPHDVEDVLREGKLSEIPRRSPVTQGADLITLDATTPYYINRAVIDLEGLLGGADILCIGLCHGGLLAAAGTYLQKEYRRATDSNSLFYPVRFSMHKLNDERPQVTKEELKRLRNEVEDRELVIIDEDSSFDETPLRPTTAKVAVSFFRKKLGKKPTFISTQNGLIID